MKDLLLFFKSKYFFINLGLAILIGVFAFWYSFKSLNSFTHHGETVVVPNFSNVKTEELDNFISDKSLTYEIIDSIFDFKVAGGVVVKQDPEKNESVKQNRTVYLTVSAKLAPLVKMPNIVDASMRQALALLESYGLKVGKRKYQADPCVNCVLSQSMNGNSIEPGTMIPKGSYIDLVLGLGKDGQKIKTPCFTGYLYNNAVQKIAEYGFLEGKVSCDDCKSKADYDHATVIGQIPSCKSDMLLDPGSSINLYISLKNKKDPTEDSSAYDE